MMTERGQRVVGALDDGGEHACGTSYSGLMAINPARRTCESSSVTGVGSWEEEDICNASACGAVKSV